MANVNSVRIAQGSQCFVSTATPSGQTTAAYNDSSSFAHASNAGRYMQALGLLTWNHSGGRTRNVPISEPLDQTVVTKMVQDIANPGTLELTFNTDEDDVGQAALKTAASAKTPIVVKIMMEAEAGGAAHQEDDVAVYFRGYVSAFSPYNAGSGGTYLNLAVTVDLVVDPL